MSDPTPPAVSEAMREAVDALVAAVEDRAREARNMWGAGPISGDTHVQVCRDLLDAEIARLTGERDAARADWAKLSFACGNEWQRAEAAEAETARLRAALEGEVQRRQKMDVFGIVIHALEAGLWGIQPDTRDAIARSISSQVRAALTSQEKTDV